MAFLGKFVLLIVALMASLNDNVDAQHRAYYPGFPGWVRHYSIKEGKRVDENRQTYCPGCEDIPDIIYETNGEQQTTSTSAPQTNQKRNNFQQRLLALDQLMHEYFYDVKKVEESRQ